MVEWAQDSNAGGAGSGRADEAAHGYVRNPFEGEVFQIGPVLVTLKATAAQTNGRFALVELTVPPYFAGFVPHLHRQTSKSIYLTQGMLAVTLGEETMVVRQGSFIMIPPQTVHRVWNPAATQATFLAYYAPAGAEGFFAALAAMALPVDPQQAGELAPGILDAVWATGMAFDHHAPDAAPLP